ncbi:uncharacterized protein METZ01_LOCUS494190, partial [marine metagenome]
IYHTIFLATEWNGLFYICLCHKERVWQGYCKPPFDYNRSVNGDCSGVHIRTFNSGSL